MRSVVAVAWHFRINESSRRTIVKKKKNCKIVATASLADVESLVLFAKYLFISYWRCGFYVGIGLLQEDIPVDQYDLRKISHHMTKQMEGERSEAGEFNAGKGWFDNF